MSSSEEQLRCNICNSVISFKDKQEHLLTAEHKANRSKLEENLAKTRARVYENDSSVVQYWERGLNSTK
jgi:hypothetical protein